jgi:hypothetical protein
VASSEYYADLQIVQTALTPHVLGSPRRDPPGADSAYVLNRGAGEGVECCINVQFVSKPC